MKRKFKNRAQRLSAILIAVVLVFFAASSKDASAALTDSGTLGSIGSSDEDGEDFGELLSQLQTTTTEEATEEDTEESTEEETEETTEEEAEETTEEATGEETEEETEETTEEETSCAHENTSVVNASEATCTSAGYTGDTVCDDCGQTLISGKTEAALGHTYVQTITKATTSKSGKIVKKCSTCGKSTTTTIAKIKSVTLSYTTCKYTGSSRKPTVTVKDSNGNKISKTYYTVTYSNNKNVGKATVKIKFKTRYSGTVTKTFKIKPKATSVKKLTAKSKGFKVTWSKISTQASGYQIQYSTSKSFSSKSTKTIKSCKTTSKTITGLKSKKKYYIRIRTYKTVSGVKYYSSWSAVKSVKTK